MHNCAVLLCFLFVVRHCVLIFFSFPFFFLFWLVVVVIVVVVFFRCLLFSLNHLQVHYKLFNAIIIIIMFISYIAQSSMR